MPSRPRRRRPRPRRVVSPPRSALADTTFGRVFQMAMAVVSLTLAIRNSSGRYTSPDLDNQLRTAINLASELGLHQE